MSNDVPRPLRIMPLGFSTVALLISLESLWTHANKNDLPQDSLDEKYNFITAKDGFLSYVSINAEGSQYDADSYSYERIEFHYKSMNETMVIDKTLDYRG